MILSIIDVYDTKSKSVIKNSNNVGQQPLRIKSTKQKQKEDDDCAC